MSTTFFSLPREIREQIYCEYFPDEVIITQQTCSKDRFHKQCQALNVKKTDINILWTSNKINEEAAQVLHGKNFRLQLPANLKVFRPFPSSLKINMRNVRIIATPPWNDDGGTYHRIFIVTLAQLAESKEARASFTLEFHTNHFDFSASNTSLLPCVGRLTSFRTVRVDIISQANRIFPKPLSAFGYLGYASEDTFERFVRQLRVSLGPGQIAEMGYNQDRFTRRVEFRPVDHHGQ